MRGQAAAAIVVIIAIVIVAVVIFPRLGINFSGGYGPPVPTAKFSNDVISAGGFSISDRAPFSGSSMTMIFSVTNNGDKDFGASNGLTVSFTDLPNIDDISLQCPDDSTKVGKFACNINRLESLDTKTIKADLKVKSGIKNEIQTSTIKYSISYKMTGGVEARIPIVEDPIFLPKDAKFQVGTPTYGPIQVTVKPPAGRERKVGGQTVVDNFVYKDSPFSLELSVKDIGSLAKQQVKMTGGDLQINLAENLAAEQCDKMELNSGDKTVLTLVTELEQKVPFEVVCNVKSLPSTSSYLIGVVSVSYKYDYKILGSETITIRPFADSTAKETAPKK